MLFLRAYPRVEEGAGDDLGAPVRFVASTEGVKRDGKDLQMEDWDLTRYDKHPVVLWVHDLWGERLPLGTAVTSFEERALIADVYYDVDDPFAMQVRSKALKGMIAASVQWDEVRRGEDGPVVNELMEISNVPVPLDPDALTVRQQGALRNLRADLDALLGLEGKRRAKPPHATEKAGEDVAWDGAAEVAAAEGAEQLWMMHAWRDDEMDPETKRAYKLPHHLHTGEVVWRGVAAAMGRLFQATTQIPDGDRRGVYNHLARHYGQFDKEAPEFRALENVDKLGAELVRGLFLEGEVEMWPETFGLEPVPEVDPDLVALHRILCQEE